MPVTTVPLPHINLLHGRSEQLRRERSLYARVQFVAMVILVMYIGLLVALVAVRTYYADQQKKLGEAISTETLALAQLKPTEERYVLLQNKVGLVTDFLRSRGAARTYLLDIYQNLPAGVQLASVTLGADENTLAIGAQAKTMTAIIDYLNQVQASALQGAYKQITVSGLGRNTDGSYAINAEYTLPK